jgi:uncharacterized protein (DUF362 family)
MAMNNPAQDHSGISRRRFLLGTATCLATGGLAVSAPKKKKPAFSLPGPYPGRVIEVHHPGSVLKGQIKLTPVQAMVDRGMRELTGAPDAVQAWRCLFQKGDRVGLKVNPVGSAGRGADFGAISNFAVVKAIVHGLHRAGLTDRDIVLFERYADQFRGAGYEDFLQHELPGIKWYAGSYQYSHTQTDLAGLDSFKGNKAPRDPHVLGYDRDVLVRFDFTHPDHDPRDPLRLESHLSRIVTGDLVNKIINIPVLKDHGSAGVTLALKNISHGMVNNVSRSHVGTRLGENRCGEFIPRVVALPALRQKIVLHVLDGLIACWQGGPGHLGSWATWPYRTLFFATDPVALDHVGWGIVDAERIRRGWPAVARSGINGDNRSGMEEFYLRQPEHIELAGKLELGVFDLARVTHLHCSLKV